MLLEFVLPLALLCRVWALPNGGGSGPFSHEACERICYEISSVSEVFYPGSPDYEKDIAHWANSSTQFSRCSVEPGKAEDVGKILRIVAATRTPFAVKGGGHSSNPGFSSTTGVHIAMYRFSDVVYDGQTQTAKIGAGLTWGEVYEALEPHSVSVVGARVPTIGVAGFTLGGGYTWKSNQYGLTLDNVVAYELVLPNGTTTTVTQETNSELLFGLRGGLNNFGIVTNFIMKTYPQSEVWGGQIRYSVNHSEAVHAAHARYAREVTDPKAQTLTSYAMDPRSGNIMLVQSFYYDGPAPPPGVFDDFLTIPSLTNDVHTQSFLSLVNSVQYNTSAPRHLFETLSLRGLSTDLLAAVANETSFWNTKLRPFSGISMFYSVQSLLPTILTHSNVPSAYPPSRERAFAPMHIFFTWNSSASDSIMRAAARESAERLKQFAIAEGQDIDDAPLYPNSVQPDTLLEAMYGTNVHRLRALHAAVDPDDVMGLAGGFKF